MSIDKAYMHAEDAYARIGQVIDSMRGMSIEREPLEAVQLDLFRTLKELADIMDDGK